MATTAAAAAGKAVAAGGATQYKKHTHREHILELPDTYIGSAHAQAEARWVYNAALGCMEHRTVQTCPGLLKVFDEVLVNAMDHHVRLGVQMATDTTLQPVKAIAVTLTPQRLTVRNDGTGIPVAKHAEHGCHAAELIFGHLLTSSNYDKGEDKIVGGKNGYGAKLSNIFSREFTLETVGTTPEGGLARYRQTWRDNMTVCEAPVIKAVASTTRPYTEVSFVPDLARFAWPGGAAEVAGGIPADMLAVLATRVVDAAGTINRGLASKDACKVSLNGAALSANTFPKYVALYGAPPPPSSGGPAEAAAEEEAADDDAATTATAESGAAKKGKASASAVDKSVVAYYRAGERWEVAGVLTRRLFGDVSAAPDDRHVSFVNGLFTRRGGKHVEAVARAVLGDFCEKAKKKAKLDLTPAVLKDAVTWFVNSTIVNPSFDTQSKETLTTPPSKFGSTPDFTDGKFVDALIKAGLLEEAQAMLDAKTARDARKTDGRKKSTLRGIPKLEDALWAGTPKSGECTLILTEGDSAATTAISGLKVVGRERYGVFPLRGKMLNVKDANPSQKTANVEIAAIKQILGLEAGKVYADVKQLRYGRVMIMTDADVDGSHIRGLCMNLFHTDWPSLMRIGFLVTLATPLIKASKGMGASATTLSFYNEGDFEAWRVAQGEAGQRGWRTKYFKGLGTSSPEEAREYFRDMSIIAYDHDADTDGSMELAFNKKRADDRKEWLATYDAKRTLPVAKGVTHVTYTRFVNDEMIHFSVADNARSLPHVCDGLKVSLRKILWASFKRNLTSEIRVAQLAGSVSETAAYHHGEASLQGAITGLAQNYVGSNNANLLVPVGQFGSRIQGGADSASPRYIHTYLDPLARALFPKADDAVLKYTEDDGMAVEPACYYPVLPMLLVNGAVGIGTGYSTDVPPYNPVDLMAAMRARLRGEVGTLEGVTLTPWWRGFKGTVTEAPSGKGKGGFVTRGVYEFADHDKCIIKISELPVGVWSQNYKQHLDSLLTGEDQSHGLKSFDATYSDVDASFTLYMTEHAYHDARGGGPAITEFESKMKLTSVWRTSNMVAFDVDGKIRRFATAGEIMERYYGARLAKYGERKACELGRLDGELTEVGARLLFVKAVVAGRLKVANAADEELLAGLKALGVPPLSDPEKRDDLAGYEYLMKSRIDRLRASAVLALEKEEAHAKEARAALSAKSAEDLWMTDLTVFEAAWADHEARREASMPRGEDGDAGGASKKGGAGKKRAAAAKK